MATPIIPNPFDLVTDDELFQMQVAIEYGCLRSRAAINDRHKSHICGLGEILRQEADARGSKKPDFPFPPP